MPHRTLVDGVEWIRDDWDDQYGHGVNVLTGRIERHCSWDGVWELKKELVASAWDGMGVSSLRACGCLRAIPIESKKPGAIFACSRLRYTYRFRFIEIRGFDCETALLVFSFKPFTIWFWLRELCKAREKKRERCGLCLGFYCHSNLPSPFVVVGQSAVPPYHLHHYHHPASPAQPPRHPQQPPRVPPSSTTTTKQLSTTIQGSIT